MFPTEYLCFILITYMHLSFYPVLTFGGPFIDTGNGYFASWGGFLLAAKFGLHQMEREDEIV